MLIVRGTEVSNCWLDQYDYFLLLSKHLEPFVVK